MKFVNGHVVIDDVYICNFMKTSGSLEFMDACETMLKTICSMYENQKHQTRQTDDALLSSRLNAFKHELLESILVSRPKIDTSELVSTLRTVNEHNAMTLASKFDQIPSKMDELRLKMDTIKEKIDVTKVVESTITRTNESLVHAMKSVTEQVSQMSGKVETFSSARNTTRFKGEEGERGLHDVIENSLPPRDGYTILDTKSIPHSCDMVIKRIGFPDVRIESKAHGRDNGESVRTQEVKRFESDLEHLNTHGIFISLYSGICGKGTIEFELLPTTRKFAFYLSRNEFDGGMIAEIVRLIYKLDTFVTSEDDSNTMKITHESIVNIKSHLNDFNRKIDDLKTNAKNSLRILNEITLVTIEKLLTNSNVTQSSTCEPKQKVPLMCDKCNQVFKNKSGLNMHTKSCGKNSVSV
jgi:uncharacterized coiled-coil DUF342 family protein